MDQFKILSCSPLIFSWHFIAVSSWSHDAFPQLTESHEIIQGSIDIADSSYKAFCFLSCDASC
jgi:hypothetical protein